jgi:hypothetical protein
MHGSFNRARSLHYLIFICLAVGPAPKALALLTEPISAATGFIFSGKCRDFNAKPCAAHSSAFAPLSSAQTKLQENAYFSWASANQAAKVKCESDFLSALLNDKTKMIETMNDIHVKIQLYMMLQKEFIQTDRQFHDLYLLRAFTPAQIEKDPVARDMREKLVTLAKLKSSVIDSMEFTEYPELREQIRNFLEFNQTSYEQKASDVDKAVGNLIKNLPKELNHWRDTLVEENKKNKFGITTQRALTKENLFEDYVREKIGTDSGKKAQAKQVYCDLNAHYGTALDNVETALNLGILVIPFLDEAMLARMGFDSFESFSAFKLTEKTAHMLRIAGTLMFRYSVAETIEKDCFDPKTIAVLGRNRCEQAKDLSNTQETQLTNRNCLLGVALNAAPVVVITALKGANAILGKDPTLELALQRIGHETQANKLQEVKEAIDQPVGVTSILAKRKEFDSYRKKSGLRFNREPAKIPDEMTEAEERQIVEYQSNIEKLQKQRSIEANAAKGRLTVIQSEKAAELLKIKTEYAHLSEEFDLLTKELSQTRPGTPEFTALLNRRGKVLSAQTELNGIAMKLQPQLANLSRDLYSLDSPQRGVSSTLPEDVKSSLLRLNEEIREVADSRDTITIEINRRLKAHMEAQRNWLSSSLVSFQTKFSSEVPPPLQKEIKAEIYSVDRGSLHPTSENPNAPFLEHKGILADLAEADKMGTRVVIDPYVYISAGKTAAYFSPATNSIHIPANMPYHLFKHELTHAQFGYSIMRKVSGLKFKPGSTINHLFTPEEISEFGKERIDRINELIGKGLGTNGLNRAVAINERLAVDTQLELLGFRRYVGKNSTTEAYANYHALLEYENIAKANGGKLPPQFQEEMAAVERRMGVLTLISKSQTGAPWKTVSKAIGDAQLIRVGAQSYQESLKNPKSEANLGDFYFDGAGNIFFRDANGKLQAMHLQ